MADKVPFDLHADFASIHVDRKITVIPDVQGSPRVLVGQPAELVAQHGSWRLEKRL